MEYITVKEAAENWGISIRRVQYLCGQGIISNAKRHGRSWAIPKTAGKPEDRRFKAARSKPVISREYEVPDKFEKYLFGYLEQFPLPIQVYRPDGMLAFANSASLDLVHIPSFNLLDGSFNILTDPVIESWGDVRGDIIKSFQGKTVRFEHLKVPIQEIIKRFEINELCFDSSFQDIICFPAYDNRKQLTYVIHFFITTNMFMGKEEIVKAKEYLDTHWYAEFDINKVAAFVNLSRYHFARMFKKHTSMTPYGYYQELKIDRLKEALCDKNLTISEAFTACGLDYSGNFAGVFKRKVGMTPSQYRKLTE